MLSAPTVEVAMALGIDIFAKYQTVTNWAAVKGAGVTFVYVKVSDGGNRSGVEGGRVRYPSDGLVAGARSVGIPVGGYHYAQSSPSPERQAEILVDEIRRTGALNLAPALDLEAPFTPNAAARDFAIRFCRRVEGLGFRPGVYMNASFAQQLRPDQWGIPNLVIWVARYGNRPEAPGSVRYVGRYDIHQYSSSGTIAGIAEAVDLNESYTNNPFDPVFHSRVIGGDEVASIKDYDPCPRGDDGNLVTRKHVYTLPVGRNSQVTAAAWLSFKCGAGEDGPGAEYVRLMSIRGDDLAGLPGGNYPVDKNWSDIPTDRTRVYIDAAEGQDSFVAYVRSQNPYSLTIEIKPK
jgi:GH25 family lysozyme M1 (1,4-beta-N-acetylmuramidase)